MVAHPSPLGAIEAPRNRWGNLGWYDEVGPKFLDGNPRKFLGWVPYQELGTPLFPARNFHEGNLIGHPRRGRDRRATWSAKGRGSGASILESLWGRARGCFGGPVGLRNGTRQRGGQQSTRGILKHLAVLP